MADTDPPVIPRNVSTGSGGDGGCPMAVKVIAMVACVGLLFLLIHFNVVALVVLAFAGVLLGVLLRGLSDGVSRWTGLGHGWSLGIVTGVAVGVMGLGLWLMASRLGEQFSQLAEQLPRSLEHLRQELQRHTVTRALVRAAPTGPPVASSDLLSGLFGVLSSTADAAATAVVVLVAGLYLAAEPAVYVKGLVMLVPLRGRKRAEEVLEAVGYTLRWWIIGQAASMTVIGLLAIGGLWLVGMPLFVALGILTALLNFIPTLGPLIAYVPVVLVALAISPVQALWVSVVYLGIHLVEGYLLTPLIQRETVWLPPALTIVIQVLFGWLMGILGIMFAAPLTAAGIVLIKMLYVEDYLGDRRVAVKARKAESPPAA
ncbi:MAG TPA: AI-2E family transporter [Tepidisphaeraceae bacterium]|nr:AI-2E family transporter [Tepidisphaeraceae bacterium]